MVKRNSLTPSYNIIGIDRRAMEEVFVPFKSKTARIGLTINSSKTNYMIADKQRWFISGGGSETVLDGEKFEIVEEFVRLLELNDVTRKIERRNQLKSRSLRTKFALQSTLI